MLTSRRGRFLLLLSVLCVLAIGVLIYRGLDAPQYQLVGNRQEFAANACAEYAPTGQDRYRTVFVDPGHGGPDPGATTSAPGGGELEEKNVTLAVALDMLPLLRAAGYHVVLSRDADGPVAVLGPGMLQGGLYTTQGVHQDLVARIDCANAAHAQLLLSIHFDSYLDPSVGGAETAYDPSRPFSAQSERFAGLVQQEVLAGFAAQGWDVPDRGVKMDSELGTPALTAQGAAYGHLMLLGPAQPGWLATPSQMPGALCEPLFLTDPGEALVAESKTGQRALARAFVAAIQAYFSPSSR